jgi:hypothetical protein
MLVCGYGAALAEKRVALVIGNSEYSGNIPALTNPTNDATDMANALTAVGFQVVLKKDVTKDEFDQALADFATLAGNSDSALFYYAGHGVQYKGQNYLLPVDSSPKSNNEIRFRTISLNTVIEAINEAKQTKIVILDACRNSVQDSGKSKSRSVTGIGDASGLAPIDSSDGMIVFYSAEHGKQALDGSGDDPNSPFTKSLVNRIKEPGLEIHELFTRVSQDVKSVTDSVQHPETVSSELTTDFFLNPSESDHIVWDRIHGSSDRAVFLDFIRRFPSSPLAQDAQDKLDLFDLRRREADSKKDEDRRNKDAERQQAQQAELLKRQAELQDIEATQAIEDAAHTARKRVADEINAVRAFARAEADRIAAEKRQVLQEAADKAAAEKAARLAQIEADKQAAAQRAADEAAAKRQQLA